MKRFPWGSPLYIRPINKQAANLLKGEEGILKRKDDITTTRPVDRRTKRECPFCGARKIGLEDHIRAKHQEPPKLPADRVRIGRKFRMDEPSGTKPDTYRTACPCCGRFFTRLASHIQRAHPKNSVRCPYPECGTWLAIGRAGCHICPGCRKRFTLSPRFRVFGKRLMCPFCREEMYNERSGRIRCKCCRNSIRVKKDLSPYKRQK